MALQPVDTCECQYHLPEQWVRKHEKNYCIPKLSCVPLDQIAIPKPWNPQRLEEIRKWATEETLNSASVEVEVQGRFIGVDSLRLPHLSRTDGGKYTVADGIHRVNRAKELGLKCILAWAEDCHGG